MWRAAGRGLFLGTSRRMHPDVCAFVSEVVYDHRLESLPECSRQGLAGDGPFAGAGLRWVPVEHESNHTSSLEEVAAVLGVVNQLLGATWTDADGGMRALSHADILVVAPYNAQVTRLADQLPDAVAVGTVDRFQGQQAPVTIYSMAHQPSRARATRPGPPSTASSGSTSRCHAPRA